MNIDKNQFFKTYCLWNVTCCLKIIDTPLITQDFPLYNFEN